MVFSRASITPDERMVNCFVGARTGERLAARSIRSHRMVRRTRPFGKMWPIELCIPRPVTSLLTMFTSRLICAIKAPHLATFVASLLFLG